MPKSICHILHVTHSRTRTYGRSGACSLNMVRPHCRTVVMHVDSSKKQESVCWIASCLGTAFHIWKTQSLIFYVYKGIFGLHQQARSSPVLFITTIPSSARTTNKSTSCHVCMLPIYCHYCSLTCTRRPWRFRNFPLKYGNAQSIIFEDHPRPFYRALLYARAGIIGANFT